MTDNDNTLRRKLKALCEKHQLEFEGGDGEGLEALRKRLEGKVDAQRQDHYQKLADEYGVEFDGTRDDLVRKVTKKIMSEAPEMAAEDIHEFLKTDEGKKITQTLLSGHLTDVAVAAAKGRYLVPGQHLTVAGKPYFVVEHLDKAIGHYTIAPNLSEEEGNAPTATVRVLFHRPTVKWAKELGENPAQVFGEILDSTREVAASVSSEKGEA